MKETNTTYGRVNMCCQVNNPGNPTIYRLWLDARRRQEIVDKATASGDLDAIRAARADYLDALDRLTAADAAANGEYLAAHEDEED